MIDGNISNRIITDQSGQVLPLPLLSRVMQRHEHPHHSQEDDNPSRSTNGVPPLTRIPTSHQTLLKLVFILLAVEDIGPFVEVLVVLELHVEVRLTGGVVLHLVDVFRRDGGWD